MTITQQMRNLGPGDTIDFPIHNMPSVQAMACKYSLAWGVRLKTHITEDRKSIRVTRQS